MQGWRDRWGSLASHNLVAASLDLTKLNEVSKLHVSYLKRLTGAFEVKEESKRLAHCLHNAIDPENLVSAVGEAALFTLPLSVTIVQAQDTAAQLGRRNSRCA